MQETPAIVKSIGRLWMLLIVFALLFTNEWLFLATKLSFLSGFSIMEKVWIWFFALSGLLLTLTLAVLLVGLVLENIVVGGVKIFRLLISIITSFLITLLILLMVDNFIYTLFDIGLKVMTLSQRRIISFLVLLVWIIIFRRNLTTQNQGTYFSFLNKVRGRTAGISALVALVLFITLVTQFSHSYPQVINEESEEIYRPNIVIIGIDALESAHMSVYGYDHDTTPFLLEKQNEFLIAENSFTNNTVSFGAIGALLTGKYATTTRMYFAPEVMLGNNRYEHFPGLLQKHGYHSLDMSLRWYSDPKDMNLLNAFNKANFRTIYPCVGGLGIEYLCSRFSKPVLLIEQVFDRVIEKLALLNPINTTSLVDNIRRPNEASRYIPHNDNMKLLRVGQPRHYYHEDDARIEEAFSFMNSAGNRPFFVNLHLMSTHGPVYLSRETYFSKGLGQTSEWQKEFYDDSILRMDADIRDIFEHLEDSGLLENTILVITSDHGKNHNASVRLPLMIRFPSLTNTGKVAANTGRIDVAPTLLDFMKWEIPRWMEGRSLLASVDIELDERPLFSAVPAAMITRSGDHWVQHQPLPPFYSLGGVQVIYCNQVFGWALTENVWGLSIIEGHTKPCEQVDIRSPEEFQTMIKQHLADRGYETDSLKNSKQATH